MVYFLQRGTIIRPRVGRGLFDVVQLDYMGFFEFEFGAMHRSLRAMYAAAGDLCPVEFPGVRREDGAKLLGFGGFKVTGFYDTYAAVVQSVANGTADTKERTYLPEAMQPSKMPAWVQTPEQQRAYEQVLTSFWWEIRHHVMLSFDADFMNVLPDLLRHSWAEMELPPTEATMDAVLAGATSA